jgi:hypothetical protein
VGLYALFAGGLSTFMTLLALFLSRPKRLCVEPALKNPDDGV